MEMNADMVKSELTRIMKSKKGKIITGLILGIPFIDFLLHVYEEIILYGEFDKLKPGLARFIHPVYAGFLCGSAAEEILQLIFFCVIPVFFLILYSDSYISDMKCGYIDCSVSRSDRSKYFRNKFITAFGMPFLLMLVSLVFNLICNVTVFHGGMSFRGLEQFYELMDNWFVFGYKNPYMYYLAYVLAYSVICGLSSILGLCCCILSENRCKAYPAVFFIWLVQLALPYGAVRTFQPYTEYGIKYFVFGLVCSFAIVLFVFAVTYFMKIVKIKKDGIS